MLPYVVVSLIVAAALVATGFGAFAAGLRSGAASANEYWRDYHARYLREERRQYERRLLDIAAVATRPDVRVHVPETPKE